MRPHDHPLDDVADAILDGTSIDWEEVESRAAWNGAVLVRLKILESLANFHRDTLPGGRTAPATHLGESTAPLGRVPRAATWGHLTIIEPLGRGACGEVFRARDTRLDRDVALKIIPVEFTSVDARATTIIEEGRLLARVRHPNVVTIHGAERIGDEVGLWMELVEGRTLEQLLQQGTRLTRTDVVEIGGQLCDAVVAVHAAGLLHRDIKPHNVMVAKDGRVVLMDFGTGWEARYASWATPVGTPLYLGPELLDGGAPTVQSDIYAIGVLLFHLLTGTYPVTARGLQELKQAHATHRRVDLRRARPDVPRRLARVIERAVATRAEDRWESATAMSARLRETRRHMPRAWFAALAVLGLAIGVLIAAPALRGPGGPSATPAAAEGTPAAIIPVTSTPGEKLYPALSPDGTRVAFVWKRFEKNELHVIELSTGRTRQVLGMDVTGSYPRWSPDGRSLAFYRRYLDHAGRPSAAVSIVPVSGGEPRTLWQSGSRLLADGLSWSPDGKQLALSVRPSNAEPSRIMLLNVDSLARQWLTTSGPSQAGDSRPTFSPDGTSLAFVRTTGSESALHVIELATGAVRRLPAGTHDIRDMTWTDEGRSLMFTSYHGGGRDTLWRISVSGGAAHPVAGIGEGASFPSTDAAGRRLVFVQQVLDSNLYRAEFSATGGPASRQIASSTRADTTPDISPDGSRIAFASNRGGPYEIWVADSDGGNVKQLVDLGTISKHPRWSPDGQEVAFMVRSAAFVSSIHVADAATGRSRRLTSGTSHEHWPSWSADGQWVYFASKRSGAWQPWKVPAAGGEPVLVTRSVAAKVRESTDGSVVHYADDDGRIWRMPAAGGESTLVLQRPGKPAFGGEWFAHPLGIYWVNEQARPRLAIEFFAFATGRSAPALVPAGLYDRGSGFSVSKDGRWMVFSQMDYHGADIMLIDNWRSLKPQVHRAQ